MTTIFSFSFQINHSFMSKYAELFNFYCKLSFRPSLRIGKEIKIEKYFNLILQASLSQQQLNTKIEILIQ